MCLLGPVWSLRKLPLCDIRYKHCSPLPGAVRCWPPLQLPRTQDHASTTLGASILQHSSIYLFPLKAATKIRQCVFIVSLKNAFLWWCIFATQTYEVAWVRASVYMFLQKCGAPEQWRAMNVKINILLRTNITLLVAHTAPGQPGDGRPRTQEAGGHRWRSLRQGEARQCSAAVANVKVVLLI